MADEPQYRLQRPGERGEEMFKDDPFMLASVRRLNAEPDPVKKPWWWVALLFVAGLVVAGAASAGMIALGWAFQPIVPLAGWLGGSLLFIGLVGHTPGSYRIQETDERLTLWKPRHGWMRAGFVAGGIAVTLAGPALAILDASQHPAASHPAKRPRR